MPTILVVDDAEFLRIRLKKLLTHLNYTVQEAPNGREALWLYKATRPDVVLMDVTMPEMDGLTALGEIRAFDGTARIIMLTALGQNTVAEEALRLGACGFVVKPFETSHIIQSIELALVPAR